MANNTNNSDKSKELSSYAKNWSITVNIDFERKPDTANNPDIVHANFQKIIDEFPGALAGYQIELGGKREYLHMQGFIQFQERLRGSKVKRLLCEGTGHNNIEVEVSRNPPRAILYTRKQDDTYRKGPYEFGDPKAFSKLISWAEKERDKQQKKSADQDGFNSLIDDIYDSIDADHRTVNDFLYDTNFRYFAGHSSNNRDVIQLVINKYVEDNYASQIRNISVDYICGKSGSGKTYDVYEVYGAKNIFSVDNYDGDFPFQGYKGQPVLLLDEYRSGFKWSYLLKILQGYPLQLNVKGSSTWASWTKVVIVSNIDITQQYQNTLDESRDPLYRRFINGIYFKKDSQSQRLPYFSYDDKYEAAMNPTEAGILTGMPCNMFSGNYDGCWNTVTHYVPESDSLDNAASNDELSVDGKSQTSDNSSNISDDVFDKAFSSDDESQSEEVERWLNELDDSDDDKSTMVQTTSECNKTASNDSDDSDDSDDEDYSILFEDSDDSDATKSPALVNKPREHITTLTATGDDVAHMLDGSLNPHSIVRGGDNHVS